jgi:uroporphyrin-III C-methyltransferase
MSRQPRGPQRGKVYLVGAGPGDPELLTLKALRILQSASVVLHDELVPPEVLSLARQGATVRSVGKGCGRKTMTQEEINALMIAYAQDGWTVVRLKGGDPLIFGRAGEEIRALRESGVDFEIVPGVTAASAACASARITLTQRHVASSVVFLTGHHCSGAEPSWPALGPDVTAVVYMPGRDYMELAIRLGSAGLPHDTPCLLISRAAQPPERMFRGNLGTLHQARGFPAPSILVAGQVAAAAACNARAGAPPAAVT